MAFCAYCGNQLAEVSYAPCPRCGNPSNGAPPGSIQPPVPGKGSNTAVIVIIVVVVVFVGIAILGILAAIAIPNFVTAKERTVQRRTMADVRWLATAIEAYATDNNHYPKAATVEELQPLLTPTYSKTIPLRDGWNHELRYEAWSRQGEYDSYAVGSAGKDGLWEHETLQEYTGGSTTGFDCDIVFSGGSFLQSPQLPDRR
jgi:general secretion pathway protein G